MSFRSSQRRTFHARYSVMHGSFLLCHGFILTAALMLTSALAPPPPGHMTRQNSFRTWMSRCEKNEGSARERRAWERDGDGGCSLLGQSMWLEESESEQGEYFHVKHSFRNGISTKRWLREEQNGLEVDDNVAGPEGGNAEEAERRRLLDDDNLEVQYLLNGTFLSRTGSYYVTVLLGSQKQPFDVQVDTGSDLLWINCRCDGCSNSNSSIKTHRAPFVPQNSSTVQQKACVSKDCLQLTQDYADVAPIACGAANILEDRSCQYKVTFGDGSKTMGLLLWDQLQMSTTDNTSISPTIIFGCGVRQTGMLNSPAFGLDGILGLGMGPLSLVRQLSSQRVAANSFSLCIEGRHRGGHLFIGRKSLPAPAIFIPLLASKDLSLYRLPLVGISVGGMNLGIPMQVFALDAKGNGGAVLDSGTTFTLLPALAYRPFLSQIQQIMNHTMEKVASFHCLPTNRTWSNQELARRFPNASLGFANGASWVLPPYNYLFSLNKTFLCFSAIRFRYSNTSYIGDSWLRNNDILYDLDNYQVGMIPLNCTTGRLINTTTSAIIRSSPSTFLSPPEPQNSKWGARIDVPCLRSLLVCFLVLILQLICIM